MTKRYSPSTFGFYDLNIHGEDIPADSVEISDEKWTSLLEGISLGKVVEVDKKGGVILMEPAELGADQLSAMARAKRDAMLAETDVYMVDDYPVEPDYKEKIKAYRQLLRDITAASDFPYNIIWPQMPA
jgi:hypothetical protein